MGIDASKNADRNGSSIKLRRKEFRTLLCENLERRDLMAADGPRLLSIAPNSGEIFSTTSANSLIESPREFVFRFDASIDPTTVNNGIRITRAGGDGAFGTTSPSADLVVPPAYLNFPDTANQRVIVARFSQPLLDDLYRIEVFGVDIASSSITGIRDTTAANQLLKTRRVGTDRDTYDFDLELGTKISAVVPQPIDRSASGVLSQRGKDIEIYFNDAELYNLPVATGAVTPNPKVVDPQFYNLIFTKDTVSPNDDEVFRPNSISYDPVLRRAILTFAQDIDQLPIVKGSGTFRLRVGSNAAVASSLAPISPSLVAPAVDPAGFLTGARDLGNVSGSFSTIVSEEIRTVSNALLADFPGSNFEPGHRDIQDESHQVSLPGSTADTNVGTSTIFYSFMDNQSYGFDIAGRPVFSSISPEQKQRVREVFEFYSAQLGIDVIEHLGPTTRGDLIKKIVVGDLAPNGGVSGPGDVIGLAEGGGELAIMDGAEAWDNTFGYGSNIPSTSSFFETALHEIGHLLGLGHTYDLPPGTIQGSQPLLGRPAVNPLEQIFPGDNDVVHGQHVFRPDNRDVDLYKFVVQPGAKGELRAETIAERLNDSSNLDTYLTLLRREANGTLTIVAANNNYFSDDSLVRADLTPGEYYLSVTGKGNEDNNPLTLNSGSGAVSQGRYELRIDFKSAIASQLSEEGSGSTVVGSALDGDGDGLAGGNFDFWFRAATAFTVAGNPATRTLIVDKVFTGTTRNGSLANPFNRIVEATSVARPGDIIRLVGDTRTSSLTDDVAYEIGAGGGSVGTLRDGATLDVPRGVTLMIDAGAILKFGGSKILVGSNDSTTDRSSSAIQVLGLPNNPVYFTSYQDESLGADTNPLTTVSAPGQWGGIEIRSDFDRSQGRFDREREGGFLNTISNADMRFGGGSVGVGALSRVVSPIDLFEVRPLILGNRITRSGDSAISADPNSFEETLFTEPRYQNGGAFVADYTRIGPDIRSNTLLNNSINGLFVRVDTLAGQSLKPLSVPARINDSEVTIVLGENVLIEGTPGGAIRELIGPDTNLVNFTAVSPTGGSSGFAVSLALNYLITYVDRFGQESLPSAQKSTLVNAGQSIRLNNLPTATLDYVSRKVWRQINNAGPFVLVGTVNRDDTTFIDNGLSLTGALQTQGLTELRRARRDANLVVDPGAVIKSLGGRIEVGISATMLAEGSESKPIVFTSRLDDRYGAAGNFDTNNDGIVGTNAGASAPSPGNWAGIVARHLGELSIDNAIITFGGGNSRVPGGFASFNAIEVHQSTARIANSVIENNASGTGTSGTTNRDARGVNDEAAIFVLGSQPVIINNIIRNNFTNVTDLDTAAISIDANSLNTERVRDFGRSTGPNQRENVGIGNFGPLVSNNQLGGNAINGMNIRGVTLTTESVWDDTDIVHVLRSEIVVPDFHTYGGLRLTSKSDESLVVKLQGVNAGFTAAGRPVDIMDRIGGSFQILGSPGFPVVLTSLSDDTIGAGFGFNGASLVDTNNNGLSTGTAGAWRSVRIEPFSNDRNVDQQFERETDQIADTGTNDFPSDAQDAGSLANALNGGDENLRLGVTLTGAIASPSDIDIYRFVGTAGTTVWFDMDQTSGSLDSVLELVDGNGQIIALSDNSIDESSSGGVFSNPAMIPLGRVNPLDQMAAAKRNALNGTQVDFLGVNPLDAGFRAVLPGSAGSTNNYYVRVRSSNISPVPDSSGTRSNPARLVDPALVRSGITVGQYKLQIRLQQTQEVSGTTVRFGDIRFAATGLDILGQPLQSPLVGEMGEANPNETSNQLGTPQNIGNIASADRGAISVAGRLNALNDIDYYQFSVIRDSIQQVSTTVGSHISVIIDLDYADGQGRANTQFSVFDSTGRLVLIADDSSIHDDQPAAQRGTDVTDLSRGSQGARDAYLGPIELPAGTYTLAISNKSMTPSSLRQFTDATQSTRTRVEPIDSVRRIAEERFDVQNAQLSAPLRPTTAFGPERNDLLMDQQTLAVTSAVPFNLSDVTLYSAVGRNVRIANGLTGALEGIYSTDGTSAVNFGANTALRDLAVTPGGQGVSYQQSTGGAITDGNTGTFVSLDLGNGTVATGTSGLITTTTRQVPASNPATFEVIQVPNNGGNNGVGILFDGLTFSSLFSADLGGGARAASFWGVGQRNAFPGGFQPIIGIVNGTPTAVGIGAPTIDRNILYRLSSYDTGTLGTALDPANTNLNAAQRGWGAGTGTMAHGFFVRTAGFTNGNNNVVGFTEANGTVSGLASVGTRLFAVTNQGELMGITPSATTRHVFSDSYVVINDPVTGVPIPFTGLTAGPRSLVDGTLVYSQILFGVTATGRMYAFNTAGQLQNIFPRGASFVDGVGTAGSSGISFSSLDSNLFHRSRRNQDEVGHGRDQVFNNSSDLQAGQNHSLRFGYADPAEAVLTQTGEAAGIFRVPALFNTTAAPGGAKGAVETRLFDLRDYSPDDQPYLYFNYRLDNENRNSAIGDGNNAALDTFRVYGRADDGTEILLATNNAPRNNSNRVDFDEPRGVPGSDEFDVDYSQNRDAFLREKLTSELFDNVGWRQARVSLSAFAGKKDVRIRFEYATGGDFRTGDVQRAGLELIAVPGERISDGNTFTISDPQFGLQRIFEFDLGLVLNTPSGQSIKTGDRIVIGSDIFTFSNVAGPLNIPFASTNTPADLAISIAGRLAANNYTVAISTLSPNVLNVTAKIGVPLTAAATYSILGADPQIIIGRPGLNTVAQPGQTVTSVSITNAMSAIQVRDAIQVSLARGLNVAGQANNIEAYRVRGNSVLIHDSFAGMDVVDEGPLTFSHSADFLFGAPSTARSPRVGDDFGPRDTIANRFLVASFAGQRNAGQGVQLDDIIIGFAERGEAVFNSQTGTAFTPTANYEPILLGGALPQNEIELGTYQVEVRTAAEYGKTRLDGNLYFFDPVEGFLPSGRTIGTNNRLTKSFALVVGDASRIVDGATFTLSDGINTQRFEFDIVTPGDIRRGVLPGNFAIPLLPNASAVEVAQAIRNAINDPITKASLNITAATSGDTTGALDPASLVARSTIIQLNGQVAADVLGGFTGFTSGGAPISVIQFAPDVTTLTVQPAPNIPPTRDVDFGQDLGDANIVRQQGQFIIASSTIRDSQNFGVNIDAAPQVQPGASATTGQRPYPGVPRNLVTLNSSNAVPGVVVMNNVIAGNGSGGINISGDTNTTNGIPPLSVARVLNNTLFGRGDAGVGINVNEGSAPTLINNIVSNFLFGINVTGSGVATTVLGANLYKQNGTNVAPVALNTSQSFAISLAPADPLFIDSANGRFYLASQSQAIDSSIASLENRSSIEQVKEAIGLPTSPILAPSFDVNGLRRADDPLVNTPAGQGQNVFIDRGAIDRVDFVGPIAIIQRPLDNDAAGIDRDSTDTYLRLKPGSYDFFEVLLDERTGTGTDPNTIDRNSLILTENGRTLIEGIDYIFGFSANSRTIRLTPLAGFWRSDSVYEMTLINKPTVRIDALNGATTVDGSRINLVTSNGNPVTLEFDAIGSAPVTGGFVVTVPAAGGTAIADGSTFSIRNVAGQTVTFEFDKNATSNAANRRIILSDTDTADTIAIAMGVSIAGSSLGLSPTTSGATLRLMEPRGTQFNVLTSGLGLSGVSGGAVAIPYVANASFTANMMSAAIVKALNSIGLGVKVFALGASTTIVEGVTTATGPGVSPIAPIADLAGNWLQPNRANSLTQFTILMPEVGVDFGDAIERAGTGSTSSTLQINNGVRHALYPEDVPVLALGQFATADLDGRPSVAADADDFASTFSFSAGLPLSLSARGPARLLVSTPTAGILGRTLTFTDAVAKTVTFQFTNSAVATGTNIAVNVLGLTTAAELAARLQDTILTQAIFTGRITGIYAVLDGNVVAIGGTTAHTFDLSNGGGFVQKQASGSVGIAVPANVSALASGQTFTIQDGAGNAATFQIINSASPTVLLAGNIALTLDLTVGVQTQASFANAVLAAINGAITAGRLKLPLATLAASTNIISVNGDSDDGVAFVGQFNARTPAVSVNVTSTDTGYLDAWIDWNQDNDFNDSGEQFLRTEPVNAGVNSFLVSTPTTALSGYTTARFRLSATGALFTTGLAIGGEVEDHLIEILRGTPPTAVNDNYQVNEDITLSVTAAAGVLSNDSDADSDPFTVFDSNPTVAGVQPLIAPRFGTLTLNADGSFSYVPQPNYFGTDTFVYQVTDPRLISNQPATVTITITPVNDAPFGTTTRLVVNEDNDGSPFVFSAANFGFNDPIDAPASNALLEVIIVTLPPASEGVLRLGAANVTAGQAISAALIPSLAFTPTANSNGVNKGSFTFRVRDNGGIAIGGIDTSALANTIAFDITAVNDAPSFTILNPTIALNEDPGAQSFGDFITNIATGPASAIDEIINQRVTFRVRALDPSRFAVLPSVTPLSIATGTNGTFNFTLAPDVNSDNSGPILVELQADDQGGPGTFPNGPLSLRQTVTINVAQINDPPTFNISQTTFNTTEDAPRTIITNFLTNVLVGPATAVDETTNQVATPTVRAANPSLFSFGPTLNGSGDLEFQLAPDVNRLFTGRLDIIVTVTDNGSPIEAASKTLVINAAEINDAPSFTLNKPVITVDEDNETLTGTAMTVIPDFARNLRRGPDTARDEAGLEQPAAQGLVFEPIVISNPSIFSTLPSVDDAGNLIFHTEANRSGSSVFVIRLRDTGLAGPPPNSNVGPTATYTIIIRSVNDAPEFTIPASTSVNEDQGVVSISGFATGIRPGPASAIDESTQELTFTVEADEPNIFAVLPTLQSDGTLVFRTTPNVNNNTVGLNGLLLSRRVFVTLRDNGPSTSPNVNGSARQTFVVDIAPVNDPPIPSVHVRPGVEDTRVSFTASSIIAAVAPETPDAPGPLDEQAQLIRMTQIERTTDRGGSVTPVFGTGPQAADIISFEYNPPLNYVGDDFIRYVITDNGIPTQSATGTLTIQLAPVNDPPQFIPGSDIAVQEDAAAFSAPWATAILAGPPSASDELNGLLPSIIAQTVRFDLRINSNAALFAVLPAVSPTGVLTFTLAKDANGRAIVDVIAIDDGLPVNNQSQVSRLTIVASPVNDAPGFTIIGNVSVNEDSGRYTAAAIRNIVPAEGMNNSPPTGSDEIGQTVSIITTNSNNSMFSVQPTISDLGVLEFVPAQDAFGTVVVSVVARDNGASTPPNVRQSAPKLFTITLVQQNDAPVAINDRHSTGEDTVLKIDAPGILSNDRDVDLPNDTITVSSSQAISTLGAIVSVLPNGQFTYDSRNAAQLQRLVNGETAIDTFTYTVRDVAGLLSNLATVTITVSGDNDTPVAVDDNVSVPFGQSQLLNVLANDRDPDTSIDPRTVEIGQLASHGTAIAQPTGRIDYRPAPGFRGIDTFTYRVRDALGALSNEALVTVTVNTPPVAVDDFRRTNVNTPIVILVLQNDSDADGFLNPSSVVIASGPDVGSASVQRDGSIRYSPATGFGGTATLRYSVLDNDGLASNVATVSITVGGSIHQNPSNNLDVDADGFISPIDVLILVNDLNFNGARILPSTLPVPPYLDPTGDGRIDPLDVLTVINFINARGSAGAGEGESSMADLGFSQTIVRIPTKDEIVHGIRQAEYSSSGEGQNDMAVSAVASESFTYGPVLATSDSEPESDESLESYLAGWVSKPKRSENPLDSIFADETWM